MQQGSARNLDASLERTFDMLEIIKPPGAKQIDDQMGSGKANALALDKKVLAVFGLRYTRVVTMIFLLGGA